jgi:hypothetical protein
VACASYGDSLGDEVDPLEPIRAGSVCNEAGERVTVAAPDVKDAAVTERKEVVTAQQRFEHGLALALHGCVARVQWVPARGVTRLLVVGIDLADAPRFTLGSLGRSARSLRATRTHVMSSIR